MEYYDPQSRLYVRFRDDMRQRDLNRWSAALRDWRIAHGVINVQLGHLSANEYNCACVHAAIVAEWIEASGRKAPDEADPQRLSLTDLDRLPPAADVDQLENWAPGLIQWYGGRVQLVYAALFDIPPN